MQTRLRRAGLALAIVSLLGMPSCITAALWDGQGGSSCHSTTDAEVVGRVLLTPFTLVLDAALICVYVGAHCGSACR